MTAMAPVLVTGGAGQLGREIGGLLSRLAVAYYALDLPDFDVTRHEEAARRILALKPRLIIHTAALTQVDACETERDAVFAVNADATAHLAGLCRDSGIGLVYIGTDFIFDGAKCSPYGTDDPASPCNVYGLSKLRGERAAASSGAICWVIRTSWLYGIHGNNFPKAILRAAKGGTAPRVVTDQVGTPTSAGDLAYAVCALAGILPDTPPKPPGIYHYTNRGACSRWEFASEILARSGWLTSAPTLTPVPITSGELARPAKRPAYSVLSLEKTEAAGIPTRPWREALREFLTELRQAEPDLFPQHVIKDDGMGMGT